jgi:hypothetical protein
LFNNLPKTQPRIIGRNSGRKKYPETPALQPCHRLFGQKPVLEHATGEADPLHPVFRPRLFGFLNHLVEVSGRWDVHPNLSPEAGWAALVKGGFARHAPDAPPPTT